MKRFSMEEHPENGSFVEKHYIYEGPGRAESGSIYYYVAAGEKTEFHRIDCDEYWCYNAGATLDIWKVDLDGKISITKLGIEEGAVPFVYLGKGEIFASRHEIKPEEGTFVTCITVPRFSYDGFEMFTKEQMTDKYPETKKFYE